MEAPPGVPRLLAKLAGRFSAVTCLEVVEHCYYPRLLAKTLYDLVEPSGVALVSTPFQGYWKNLLLAATGKMDSLQKVSSHRAGRTPPIAMSMIAVAEK